MNEALKQQLPSYVALLKREYFRRQEQNGKYSLRSYARYLGISPASLSEVFHGKRSLSRKSSLKVLERLELSDEERASFMMSAFSMEADKGPSSSSAEGPTEYQPVSIDEFNLIAEPYHLAILSLAKLKQPRFDAHWVARKLDISVTDARAALDRLRRMNLIANEEGLIKRLANPIFFNPQVSSVAIRRYHHKNLELAIESLTNDPKDVRDMSATTIAIDASRIDEARKIIENFRSEFAKLMEPGKKDAVYTMAIQLFPVTKTRGKS